MNVVTIFSPEVMHALGWTLIHSLWQGAGVALLLTIVLLFFRKSSSKLRYRLSVGSLLLVFAMFVGTFLLLYFSASANSETVLTQNEEIIEIIIETTATEMSGNTDFLTVYKDYFNTHLPFIVTLWFVGMLVFTLRFFGGLIYTQRLRHSHHSLVAFEWEEVMHDVKTRLNIAQNIQLVESKLVAVPMVIGYLKPMILLPIGVVNFLTISEVEAVLAHELAHIKRYDYLVNIIQSIIETLLFFHPAIWWISGEIRRERENCCDDLALEIVDSLTFAKALSKLEQFRLNSIYQRKPQFSMAAITSKNQLLNRVQRILNQPQKNHNNFRGFFAACILVISFVATSLDAQEVKTPSVIETPEVPEMMTNVEVIAEPESPVVATLPEVTEAISFPVELEAPISPVLVEAPNFPRLLTTTIDKVIPPNSPDLNFGWIPKKRAIFITENRGIHSNSTIKIKTNSSKVLNDIVSITIKKDTSITDEIKEITIVRNVKDKDGKDAELKIEIKSKSGEKTVTTYENGKKLNKDEQKKYQTYIEESKSIANNNELRFSGDREEKIRLRKEQVEHRRKIAREQARLSKERSREHKSIVREQAKLKKEQARRMAEISREQARIKKELAEHNRELAKEYEVQIAELKEEEREMMKELAEQQADLKVEMAEQALEIARVKKESIWIEQFKKELVKDGIIKKNSRKFKLKMDKKGIKVNGKKLTPTQEKKYIQLYESLTGEKWTKGHAIHVRMNSDDEEEDEE